MWNSSNQAGFFLIAIMIIGGISVVQSGVWWETSIDCYDCNGWRNNDCPERDNGAIPTKNCVASKGKHPWCRKTIRTNAYNSGPPVITVQRECFTVHYYDKRTESCKSEALGTKVWTKTCECSSGLCNL